MLMWRARDMTIPISTLLQEAGNTLVNPSPSCLEPVYGFKLPSTPAGRPFLKKLHTESRHVKAQLRRRKRRIGRVILLFFRLFSWHEYVVTFRHIYFLFSMTIWATVLAQYSNMYVAWYQMKMKAHQCIHICVDLDSKTLVDSIWRIAPTNAAPPRRRCRVEFVCSLFRKISSQLQLFVIQMDSVEKLEFFYSALSTDSSARI